MRALRVTLLAAMTLLLAPNAARAEPSIYASEPNADELARLDSAFGLYLTRPPRRHAVERVARVDDEVRLTVWVPTATLTDVELQSRAVEWLLLGRTQYAPGARALFSDWPDIDRVVLTFVDIQRTVQKSRRASAETITPFLRVRLTRSRFERLKLKAVEACVEKGDCAAVFRAAFDEARFDRKGLKR